ncbi:MAG: protein kinase [Planctomycetaceae bacterium]|nr:protein kinase [Planctomycetaceae bacterium]
MLRTRQKLGKYVIERRLAEGPFANVYRALDTIEGVRVALKVPQPHLVTKELLEEFREEVRLMARLDHAHILMLKDASLIDGHFVIALPLGQRTLADRMQTRMGLKTALRYAEQMLDAVAYAHENRIIHCDLKPENFLIFDDDWLRLADFGIARVARRTIQGSGWGTLGYMAPEQAMGKPSFRSDVFSLGLILYRMFSGRLPDWPYDWPPVGFDRLRRQIHPKMIEVVRRAMEFQSRRRYADASQMQAAFLRARPAALRFRAQKAGKKARSDTDKRDWKTIRFQQFQREHGHELAARHTCRRCGGPVAEAMAFCCWCGTSRTVHRGETAFPAACPRCKRGLKLDWRFCPWCFGPGFEVTTNRQFGDIRYEGRCENAKCTRKQLMPFMRYCPWCRTKVRRRWKVPGSSQRCSSCGWGVFRSYWSYCPWCGKRISAE